MDRTSYEHKGQSIHTLPIDSRLLDEFFKSLNNSKNDQITHIEILKNQLRLLMENPERIGYAPEYTFIEGEKK